MPLQSWVQDRLNLKKQKPGLRTGLDKLKDGEDYNNDIRSRNPRLPQYLSSDYDASPLDKSYGTNALLNQINSVTSLGTSANAVTAEAIAYRQKVLAAQQAANQQAQNERGKEIQDEINKLPTDGTGYDTSVEGNGDYRSITKTGTINFEDDIVTNRERVLDAARRRLGTPYSWGGGGGLSRGRKGATTGIGRGAGTVGFDCSGLTDYAFSKLGWKIGHYTGTQAPWAMKHGKVVPKSKLMPGDIIFGGGGPNNPGGTHHVAIYWGNGKIIEAPFTGGRVRIVPMRAGQWGIHLNY